MLVQPNQNLFLPFSIDACFQESQAKVVNDYILDTAATIGKEAFLFLFALNLLCFIIGHTIA